MRISVPLFSLWAFLYVKHTLRADFRRWKSALSVVVGKQKLYLILNEPDADESEHRFSLRSAPPVSGPYFLPFSE